ncbi:HTH_Tnp_Tc3_2 domain-containing protein [Trichonephila clavipes]|nr:HTH_Tnp_Tc3_2 domain-containing protein [Trichonephila clavipes]
MLEPCMLFGEAVEGQFLFVGSNIQSHRSSHVENYLEESFRRTLSLVSISIQQSTCDMTKEEPLHFDNPYRDPSAQVNPELQRQIRTGIYLAVTAKRNRRSTASHLSRQLSSATGTTVLRQTVYRRLEHIGLYAHRPVRCVPLTATHCRLQLTWSREHALWTEPQWSCVMFSDESRFSFQFDSRRTLIRRAPGTCYHQENTIQRNR